MDRLTWYFRQKVTNAEMAQFSDDIEEASWREVVDLLGSGIVTGGGVAEADPVSQTQVLVDATVAFDAAGRRVAVQDQFADRVSAIVLGLTLQVAGVGVPSTVGTYLLFRTAPAAAPFTLIGQTLTLAKSSEGGNNGSYVIQDVVATTWTGLIPTQIMVRIDEELAEEGWTAGLAPTGTTATLRVASPDGHVALVSLDESAVSLLPTLSGKERWVSLYARFGRFDFDERLDGNAATIAFESLEYFELVVDGSNPQANIGLATPPSLRTNGDVFLADVRLEFGATIANGDIDISRQTPMPTLPEVAARVTAIEENNPDKQTTVSTLGQQDFSFGPMTWDPSGAVLDVEIYIDGRWQETFTKLSSSVIRLAEALPAGKRVSAWKQGTSSGGGGGGGGGSGEGETVGNPAAVVYMLDQGDLTTVWAFSIINGAIDLTAV